MVSEYFDAGAKVKTHAIAISFSKRVCCLTSEQYVPDTAEGLSASAHRLDHDWLPEKIAHQIH